MKIAHRRLRNAHSLFMFVRLVAEKYIRKHLHVLASSGAVLYERYWRSSQIISWLEWLETCERARKLKDPKCFSQDSLKDWRFPAARLDV